MSKTLTDTTVLDLSKADGNILINSALINKGLISPRILSSLPSKDSYINLKQELAKYYKYSVEGITLGNGSDELIDIIARVKKGTSALTLLPTFERLFEVSQKYNYKSYTISLPKNNSYLYTDVFHKEVISKAISINPDIIWISSPDNPTGSIIDPAKIRDISLKNNEAWVVIDCAFADIANESLISDYSKLISECRNLIILGSFSKTWGIAALRIGFALADPNLSKLFNNESQMFNVNSIASEIAKLCLENSSYRNDAFNKIYRSIDQIKKITESKSSYEIIYNSPINLFCIRNINNPDLHTDLLKNGIKTKSLDNMPGMQKMGYCRILIPDSKTNLKKLISSLLLLA